MNSDRQSPAVVTESPPSRSSTLVPPGVQNSQGPLIPAPPRLPAESGTYLRNLSEPLPTPVLVATVLLALTLPIEVRMVAAERLPAGLLAAVDAAVLGLLLFGFLRRSALALFAGRAFAHLVLLSVPLHVAYDSQGGGSVLTAVVASVFSGLFLQLLSSDATKKYFGLQCPICGHLGTRLKGPLLVDRACRNIDCKHEWTA